MFEALLIIIVMTGPDSYTDIVAKVPATQTCEEAVKVGERIILQQFPRGLPYVITCHKVRTVGETKT